MALEVPKKFFTQKEKTLILIFVNFEGGEGTLRKKKRDFNLPLSGSLGDFVKESTVFSVLVST